jgi:DNA-binding transcriptional ArsR family regulator
MSKTSTATAARRPKAKRTEDTHELNSNIVKAMSHPLRLRILGRLNEGVASPNEMAKEFGESLPLVSYHVRILRELNCIELVKTTPRRGAIEHHYRALQRAFLDESDWAQMPQSARRALSSAGLDKALNDVRAAMDADTFDARTDRHQSYAPLLLDEQAWSELNGKLEEVLMWALEEQSRAAVRIRDGEGEDVRARMLMLTYTGAPAGMKESGDVKRRRAKR